VSTRATAGQAALLEPGAERAPEPCTIVIFGASGDLTRRKLMPALYALFRQGLLPKNFAILGTSRSPFTDDAYRKKIIEDVVTYAGIKKSEQKQLEPFSKHVYYLAMDATNALPDCGCAGRQRLTDQTRKPPGHPGTQAVKKQTTLDLSHETGLRKPFARQGKRYRARNRYQGCGCPGTLTRKV